MRVCLCFTVKNGVKTFFSPVFQAEAFFRTSSQIFNENLINCAYINVYVTVETPIQCHF